MERTAIKKIQELYSSMDIESGFLVSKTAYEAISLALHFMTKQDYIVLMYDEDTDGDVVITFGYYDKRDAIRLIDIIQEAREREL